jgi:hypothetical protein
MPAGSARDDLAQLIAAHGPAVRCADPADASAVAEAAPGCTAIVHLPAEDPFSSGENAALNPDQRAVGFAADSGSTVSTAGGAANGARSSSGAAASVAAQAETVASVAAAARARLVFCSSVLLYADGGDDELMANDPELDPPAGLSGLADAELEVFGSRAEVMVLRLGILLAKGGSHARSLSGLLAQREGSLPRPGVHLPLLDRSSLAEAIASVSGSQLHGGWDVVAATPTWAEVADWAKAEGLVQPVAAAEPSAADQPDPVWGVSRNVTGAALRGTGAVGEGDWHQILAGALR